MLAAIVIEFLLGFFFYQYLLCITLPKVDLKSPTPFPWKSHKMRKQWKSTRIIIFIQHWKFNLTEIPNDRRCQIEFNYQSNYEPIQYVLAWIQTNYYFFLIQGNQQSFQTARQGRNLNAETCQGVCTQLWVSTYPCYLRLSEWQEMSNTILWM